MNDDEIFDYLIDNACVGTVAELLLPDAEIIRLYNHYPEPAVIWWNASLPLSRHGPNRNLQVQSLGYDVEMPKAVFLEAVDELSKSHGGLTLIQSYKPLPPSIHPGRFRNRQTLLRVVGRCGACLFFDLPHDNETAGLTIFGKEHLDHLIGGGFISSEDTLES